MKDNIHRLAGILTVSLIIASLIFAPVAGKTESDEGAIEVHCSFPGQVVEAGETATFDFSVTNHGVEQQRSLWYEDFRGSSYWEMKFMQGETEVNKFCLPPGQSGTITFVIETTGDTRVGEYPVKVHIGDAYYWIYVTISKSHTGETGILDLRAVDKDGEKIKGATVTAYEGSSKIPFDSVMTTADGSISTDLPQGTYRVDIRKPGYGSAERKDIKVRCGITTDIGTVTLNKADYAAEVTINAPTVTTSVGNNPTFDMVLRNVGKSDDTYKLESEQIPEGWFVRYKDDAKATDEISEIYIESGGERKLYLEAIPPYGADVGDYAFRYLIESSTDDYTQNLTAKLRGSYDLKVYAEKYRYEVNKGETLSYDISVRNTGNAGALTGIKTEVKAPEGWKAVISPESIPSLQPGERATVSLKVIPPSDIGASDYKISVTVKSDQAEKTDDYRITVHEQSFAGIFGVLLLILVAGGVWYMYRKYERR